MTRDEVAEERFAEADRRMHLGIRTTPSPVEPPVAPRPAGR
jgi:hypothetical protein